MVGYQIGTLLEATVALLFGLGIAFGYSWLTSLVILAFLPVMVVANALGIPLEAGSSGTSKKALRASTEVKQYSCSLTGQTLSVSQRRKGLACKTSIAGL